MDNAQQFFKSINTTVSQLSQAKATSKQVEKQLVDHKVKLAAHDKYQSRLNFANFRLGEASKAEKQKDQVLRDLQK